MAHALRLAARGLGRVWPNPSVGCVIVKDAIVVGRGVTAPGGRPHAEPQALAQAGPLARGATAYVTLEPCAHHGKTPPCVMALVKAGVTRVVCALQDPDPRVNGGGLAILQGHGIAVTTGVMEPEARDLQRGFLTRITAGRPMLTLKLALTLDGKIATAGGESRWITGPHSRAKVHLMRAQHDAVLVGGGTARADDPELTVRNLGIVHQPLRIVASTGLNLPQGGRLAASVAQGPLWLVHGPQAPSEARRYWSGLGARLIEIAASASGLHTGHLLQTLGTEGLTRIFCEGGGQFAASLLSQNLVDRLAVFSAGKLLGADATPGLGVLGLPSLAQAPQFSRIDVQPLGDDILHLWQAVRPIL